MAERLECPVTHRRLRTYCTKTHHVDARLKMYLVRVRRPSARRIDDGHPVWASSQYRYRSLGEGRFAALQLPATGTTTRLTNSCPGGIVANCEHGLRGRPEDTEIAGNRLRGLGLHGEAREKSWNMTWENWSPAGQIRQAAGRRNDNRALTRRQLLVEDEAHLALAPLCSCSESLARLCLTRRRREPAACPPNSTSGCWG